MLRLDELQYKRGLLQKIESLRIQLTHIGIEKGFNDKKNIEISQELDNYILKYQSLKTY
ncbi:aspartyl-phosphate phosphatase Spo0E family protein [Bacillus sp. EB600]|uniref:aspartyl-phosphate phosphatase Spo0E family protein n=1 Tax=Bacillus sp. EB600 TaxID=2806345 RepID=UPI00210ECD9D|nr:aspartyl-phosphate phosphatase Spo0E family protein [Bacillus sp. EB600]MCQ6280397.1 aspartyl-phosphate phosphatase Spo0E family protein [Bacillus sp. EB600]